MSWEPTVDDHLPSSIASMLSMSCEWCSVRHIEEPSDGTIVSCPDPTLCEGKGSGDLWHNPWARERNFDVPITSQLCQSHVTIYRWNLEAPITRQVYVCYAITELPALLGWIHNSAYKTKKSADIHQTLFPRRGWGVWGRDYVYGTENQPMCGNMYHKSILSVDGIVICSASWCTLSQSHDILSIDAMELGKCRQR